MSTDEVEREPTVGRPVMLLSMTEGEPYAGTVQSWTGSTDGLVVSARISVSAGGLDQLANQRVWLSVPEGTAGFTVYSGVAKGSPPSGLDITGIKTVLHEHRRQHLRAPADGLAHIPAADQEPRRLRLVDLSQGGVRVALREPTELVLGERVTLDVVLQDGSAVSARGLVARIDPDASHAVVRFEDLSPEQGSRIDRYVLLQLTGPTG